MTATAASWFYRAPEPDPYLISERVNGTYWEARIGGLYLRTVRPHPPLAMSGTYNGAAVKLEWEPGKWLRLHTSPDSPALANATANVLRRPPAIRYGNPEGETVWEWWLEGADRRWQEIQGKPAFRNPARLDKDNE